MSKTTQNQLTKFYSGKFGQDFVLRHYYNGKSVLAKLPKPYDTTPTKEQGVVRTKFREAVKYARFCMNDSAMLALYGPTVKVGRSVYRQAMNDYLNPPEVERIDLRDYKGYKGDTIKIVATDDFRVQNVLLKIVSGDGTLIEEGQCTPKKSKDVWEYSATSDVPSVAGFIITATAFDYAGNRGKRAVEMKNEK
jgi:hypothetical protein